MANVRPDPTDAAAGTKLPPRRDRHVGEDEPSLKSDLSADLEVTADELDAIARLLGDDLKAFLSGS